MKRKELQDVIKSKNTRSNRAKVLQILKKKHSIQQVMVKLNEVFEGKLDGISNDLFNEIVISLGFEKGNPPKPLQNIIIGRNEIIIEKR